MEQIMKVLTERELIDEHTLGMLVVDKEFHNDSNLELDILLIKITSQVEVQEKLMHFTIGNKSVEFQVVNEPQISLSLINGQNRRLVDWIMNGTILEESDCFITELRRSIEEFPICNRKYKIAVEFSKLINRYSQGKQLFNNGHYLDAFNSILHSLHHLARISVIEHGIYPEVTVWQQVKQLEPEIYKLYEEMVTGEESIKKRIELILLANNFAITSKTKLGASHLIEVMKGKNEAWSIDGLLNHHELKEYGADLVGLIEYLVQKGIVDIVKVETGVEDVYLRYYFVK
ncbi:hypothetical protein H1D32_03850 [Anaerobacillus sp. CMMVII]|uniref:nucleotidyltransferase-like protein n=1 Tax=Anaerobacillus sp. CMMVII TaxID=2755588 RepID=UPI0021B7FFD0|nr:nucleotidyltransferase-like protein [Anaerobacillus sp. CMMVII]MCT8136962.1 hypothetical protein [Anaerobacillus sp. CMMVII]